MNNVPSQKWHNVSLNTFLIFAGCLPPSAAAAWRKSPPQSLWCAPWSASTTSTASAAACATASWGRATSLSWRRVSCSARSTTRGRRTYSARSAPMTQTQVSPLHPLAGEREQHGGAIIVWHRGVVFCRLRSITVAANIDIRHSGSKVTLAGCSTTLSILTATTSSDLSTEELLQIRDQRSCMQLRQ